MPDPVLALDLGGTSIRAGLVRGAEQDPLVEQAPRVERMDSVPTPAADGPAAILAAARDLAEQVRGGTAIAAVGISSAGVIDARRGRVTHATGSLADWAGTDVAAPFAERFGAPTSVLNDVHAHGIGEARFGVGRGRGSLLLIAVGTGIGGCQVIDDSPVLGSHGAAGHVGHLAVPEAEGVPCPCGRDGHLEGLASGPGIVRLAEHLRAAASGDADRATQPGYGDGHALARAARDGDPSAVEAYRIAGFATGRVIGGLLNVVDAEVVALSGGVSEVGDRWREAVHRGIVHDAMDVVAGTPVLPATAGTHAALLGAAARAQDDLLASPKGSPCIP